MIQVIYDQLTYKGQLLQVFRADDQSVEAVEEICLNTFFYELGPRTATQATIVNDADLDIRGLYIQ